MESIASEFGISKRTVYRDLRLLQEADVPLTYNPDEGYGIMRGGTVPPLMFTTKQLATVMMGLSFVKSQVDETLVEDAREVELKINSVVPGELKDFMNALDQKTIVDPHAGKKVLKKKGGNWFDICTALSGEKPIRFSYRDKKDAVSVRVIDPLLLVFYNDHWNVIGYCHNREQPRSFILDRMSAIEISDERIRLQEQYTKEQLLYRKSGQKVEIILKVSKTIERQFLASLPAQLSKQEDSGMDEVRLVFDFDNLDYLNKWLLSFGDEVTVLGPSLLLRKRKELLMRMLESTSKD